MISTLHQTQSGSCSEAAVTVWRCPLDLSADVLATFVQTLSGDERERMALRARAVDRDRYGASRGWCRRVLAAQLGCRAQDVSIAVDERGKPGVPGSKLRFSHSRSAELALVATSWQMDVGVDIEKATADTDGERIAARMFSADERRGLAALPTAQRQAAFFDCWTRREAYVKGIGTGLGVGLPAVTVWSGDDRPVVIQGWSIHHVEVGAGFAGAVAGGDAQLVPRQVAVRWMTEQHGAMTRDR